MSWRDTQFFGLNLTDEQKRYLDSIEQYRLTLCNAKSGTGKTTLAVGMAKLLKKPTLYIFAPVQEKKLGFLPGDLEEKTDPYTQPLKDALLAINENPEQAIFKKVKEGQSPKFVNQHAWVYAMSHVFARGTNIKGMTVILDELQNYTKPEAKKILTRIHDDCTVIGIGHTGQIDLHDPKQSCFERVLEHFGPKHYCNIVELTKNFRGELSLDADDL